MPDKIYLRVNEDDDGVRTVVDQDGREVAGLRSMSLIVALEDVNRLTIECFEHKEDSEPNINRKSGISPC